MKPEKVITVGRSSQNTIVIDDPKVSRVHCQFIRFNDGSYRLADFGSLNGTYVNGQKVSGEMQLNSYDVVRIGNTTLPWRDYFDRPVQQQRPYQQPVAPQPVYPSSTPSYTPVDSDEADGMGVAAFISGILSLCVVLYIIIHFLTSGILKWMDFGDAIKLFPAYLNGGSFGDGQWIFIIIAILLGGTADLLAGLNKRESKLQSAGLWLGNFGMGIAFIFLILAIFAKNITVSLL